MAKLCCIFSGLCAYFFIISRITFVHSINDYYFYDQGLASDNPFIKLKLAEKQQQQQQHSISKRELLLNNTLPSSNKTTTNDDLLVAAMKTSPPPATNVTKTVTTMVSKNLGVNGTGQRKNYPPAEKPVTTTILNVANTTTTTNSSSSSATSSSTTTIKPSITGDQDRGDVNDDDDDDDDVFKASNVQNFNKTLTQHNILMYKTDTHTYYNTTFLVDQKKAEHYWVDMNRSDVKINELLSTSHRRAATIKLNFDFPFYGHNIKSVTIATGGFIYTGEYVHSWLAATQYIAPLMANFDTRISNDSYIKYVDNGTSFTVEWEKVNLQDNKKDGSFTFQATLHQNGDIVFVYKTVPMTIVDIKDDNHPVKVGLSDAYIMDHTVYFVRRKTIYEYHRVNFNHEDIKNWTVIHWSALSTCVESKDCDSCLNNTETKLNCSWCPTIQKCSSGTDRHRQSWIDNKCDVYQVKESKKCTGATSKTASQNEMYKHDESDNHLNNPSGLSSDVPLNDHQDQTMGMPGIVAILFLVCVVSGLALWTLYAYRNPHTTSGQILIRYRPSQWHWLRSEARYTAATIHM